MSILQTLLPAPCPRGNPGRLSFVGIGGIAALLRHWSQSLPGWRHTTSLELILVCATIGALAALLWLRRSRYGVDEGGHARSRPLARVRRVRPDPQGPVALRRPMAMLRESGRSRPRCLSCIQGASAGLKMGGGKKGSLRHRSRTCAAPVGNSGWTRTAGEHRTAQASRTSRHWVRQVCEDLSEAAAWSGTTPTAEWILDNE